LANIKSDDFETLGPADSDRTLHRTKSQILKELKTSTRKTANLIDELEKIS
jgi:hypothetical protein